MNFREDYIEPLRSCLEGAEDWHRVQDCFQKHVEDSDVEDGRPVVYAFGYMLVASRREDARERSGVFAPAIVWENGASFPAPMEEIPEEMLPVWAEYAQAVGDHPLAASRLNDLLWVKRYGGRPVDHATPAIDAYLELASEAESMHLVDCLLRAIEIAAEIGDQARLRKALERAVEVIEAEMAGEDWRPGIPLNLLEAAADLKPESRPAELEGLLERAAERYGADPWISQSVSELQGAMLGAEERERLGAEQVARWREEAQKAKGILRYAHLQHALGLARTHGLTETAEQILAEIQSMSEDDLELKPISAEVKMPRAEIDAHIKTFTEGSGSWQDALERFGADGPPSGRSDRNRAVAEESAKDNPLTRLIPTQVLGASRSLIFEAGEEGEHERLDLAKQEALGVRIWAPIGIEILEAIAERFGVPEREELTEFFTTELIDREVAARLADVLLRFFAGDDDGALHIAVSQLEAAIRGAAARIGIVVIRNPQGERPGGVRGLGAVLAALEGRIDESWRRYLVNALVDSLGVNLRDQVSHGLYGPVIRADVAIAIHIACHLRLFE